MCDFLSGPTPPNPQATASAQTGTNVQTAVANAILNNPNQVTPQGSLTFTQDPSQTFFMADPEHPGSQFGVPKFISTQTLSPSQEQLRSQREGAQVGLATTANTEAQRLQQFLAGNVDLSNNPYGLGDPGSIRNLPSATTQFGDVGELTRSYGADNQRDRVEQALFARMQPQLDIQRNQLEQRLADQGIRYGSPAYSAAMDDFNRHLADTRLAITAQGGTEQKLQEDIAAQRAGFANTAQQAAYQQAQGRGLFTNTALQQQLTKNLAALNAQNQTRNQYLAEQYAARNQPINEIGALLSGSQLTQPQWANWNQAQIPTTDIAGLINQNFAQQSANAQMQSALLGNVIGAGARLGSAALIGSDRRMKDDIHRLGSVLAAGPPDEGRMGTTFAASSDKHELPIYQYSYKDDPTNARHVGPMAQDVERIDKGAVGKDRRGMRYIDVLRVMGSILRAA